MDTILGFLTSLATWILGAVFLLAATAKWFDLASFRYALSAFAIAPRSWTPYLAIAVPSLESILGLALLFNWQIKIVASICLVVLVTLTSILGFKLRQGKTEGCGCFGPRLDARIGRWTFVRNGLLIGLVLFILFTPSAAWNSMPAIVTALVAIPLLGWWLTGLKQAPSAAELEPPYSTSHARTLLRRDFLRQLGLAGVGFVGVSLLHGLGVTSTSAAPHLPKEADLPNAPNVCTQWYYHYDPTCGTFWCHDLQKMRHLSSYVCYLFC